MILGIGTDIVKVIRIQKALERTSSFLEKAFTEREIQYFEDRKNNVETIAGIFSAKEAISKALGTGFREFGLTDIEIDHDEYGKPIGILGVKITEKFNLKNYRLNISISHTDEEAISFAVLEGGE